MLLPQYLIYMTQKETDSLFQLDNTLKHERHKQIVFWNLYALGNINSISEMISHHRNPQLHTASDRGWRDLYFLNQVHVRGEPMEETFIARSQKYISELHKAFDRVSWIKNEQFELKVIKYEFWNKILGEAPRSRPREESRQLVSRVLWAQRISMIPPVTLFSVVFNYFAGISSLSLKSRLGVVIGCGFVAELIIRFMRSDMIFYSIPQLPDATLEKERQRILNECLFFDGTVTKYGTPNAVEQLLVKLIGQKQKDSQKEEVIRSLSMHPIKQTNLI